MILRATLCFWMMAAVAISQLQADDWPQYLGSRRDSVWHEKDVAHVRMRQTDGSTKVMAGSPWTKARQLRNLRWVGGEYPDSFLLPGRPLTDEEFPKIFHDEIDQSVEQEKRDAKGAAKSAS